MLNLAAIGQERVVERAWSERDVISYALAVGAGQEDCESELELTTENSTETDLRVLPTFATLLQVQPTLLLSDSEEPLRPDRIAGFVHGSQSLTMHGRVPTAGRVSVTGVIREIYDKGSGALVEAESEVRDATTGTPIATLVNGTFARGDGGFGGPRGEAARWERPDREPDVRRAYATAPNQALLYRLTGDRFPLHSDPAFARQAGFEGPIMHGLCTFGFTARALAQEVCGGDLAQFGSIRGRFSRPVYPGTALEVSIWRTHDGALFQTTAGGDVALDHGVFTLA
jgi:acyl dehydratase